MKSKMKNKVFRLIGAFLMTAVCMTAAMPVMAESDPDPVPVEEEIIWEEEAAAAVMVDSVEAEVEEAEVEESEAEEPEAEEADLEEDLESVSADEPSVEYCTHVQTYGW